MAKNREIVAVRRDGESWAISDLTADGCSDIMTIEINGDWWQGVVPSEQIVAAFCMVLNGNYNESVLNSLSAEDRAVINDRVEPGSRDAFAALIQQSHKKSEDWVEDVNQKMEVGI